MSPVAPTFKELMTGGVYRCGPRNQVKAGRRGEEKNSACKQLESQEAGGKYGDRRVEPERREK